MLVLTRREDDDLFFEVEGVRIRVLVLAIGENQIRLGIEAPPDVPVWRGELEDLETTPTPRRTEPGGT